MESPAISQYEELGRRIRSLTSILHEFNLQKSPTQNKEISGFLLHFTTFLTCGDKYDHHAKKVIAVAGSIAPQQQVRAVIVAQNPYSVSLLETIRLTVVDKHDEVTKQDSDLMRHIKEVLKVLSTFDPHAGDRTAQIKSLQVFFLTKSFRKFEVRFEEDVRLCGGKRLYEVIMQWKPDPNARELPRSWVNALEWLADFARAFNIPSRTTEGRLQLEFSDETKHAWSKILAGMLAAVNKATKQVKTARGLKGRRAKEELTNAMDKLNETIHGLYTLISWKADVVKTLLTRTSIVSSIPTEFKPINSDDPNDNLADLYQEPQDTKGHQVFRYLQMVTAWHAAVNSFCSNPMFPELLDNLKVGLLEVPRSSTSVLSLEETRNLFFSRFPDMREEHQIVSEEIERRHPDHFSGCVHAEAALMGLLSCCRSGSGQASYALGVGLEDSVLQHVVQPVADAVNPTIVASKKCCWCCDWLGKNLEAGFTLPGTHGIMFPWDPPKIGVSVQVLERLEEELWKALHDVVLDIVSPLYSRHSSPMGSPASPPIGPMLHPSLLSWVMEGADETG